MWDEPDSSPTEPADFDSPWKDAITHAFEPFLALLFPTVHAAIDWSRDYVPLDKELQKIHPLAETGELFVDFLAKVWRTSGEEEWILVHVEVQSQPNPAFALRMFRYNYRRSVTRDQVYFLIKIIDWMLRLPRKLDALVMAENARIEQETQMPYVTSVERFGIEKGR